MFGYISQGVDPQTGYIKYADPDSELAVEVTSRQSFVQFHIRIQASAIPQEERRGFAVLLSQQKSEAIPPIRGARKPAPNSSTSS